MQYRGFPLFNRGCGAASVRKMSHLRVLRSLRQLVLAGVLAGALLPAAIASPASAATCVGWTGAQPPDSGTKINVLQGVTVVSSCNAWAVGYQNSGGSDTILIEHWTGSAWKLVPGPEFGIAAELVSVHALSARNIWAVGRFNDGTALRTLIVHWNGTAWRVVPSPSPAGSSGDILLGVRAVSARDAWAVGSFSDGSGDQTLIVHWNGSAWKRVASPTPAGSADLFAVTATSSSNAWAVGDMHIATGERTLALHWNGHAWKQTTTPSPGLNNILTAVAASSRTNVWAVGIGASGGSARTLTVRWNGKAWAQVHSPDQGFGTTSELHGLSVLS